MKSYHDDVWMDIEKRGVQRRKACEGYRVDEQGTSKAHPQ